VAKELYRIRRGSALGLLGLSWAGVSGIIINKLSVDEIPWYAGCLIWISLCLVGGIAWVFLVETILRCRGILSADESELDRKKEEERQRSEADARLNRDLSAAAEHAACRNMLKHLNALEKALGVRIEDVPPVREEIRKRFFQVIDKFDMKRDGASLIFDPGVGTGVPIFEDIATQSYNYLMREFGQDPSLNRGGGIGDVDLY
jgi:hypothetical protein